MRKSILKASDLKIVRSPRRRRIAFSAAPDGVVSILAPVGVPDSELLRIAEANNLLIERLRRRAVRLPARPSAVFAEGEEFFLWGKKYPIRFSRRVTAFDGAFILPAGPPEQILAELEGFYRTAIRRYLVPRIRDFAAQAELKFDRIRISGAETRWGSCSTSGTISFSWKLAQCPPLLIDYVIWHELTHLEEMNHSPRFWRKLENHLPGARIRRRELRAFERLCPVFPD
jgi:hypothetical protein